MSEDEQSSGSFTDESVSSLDPSPPREHTPKLPEFAPKYLYFACASPLRPKQILRTKPCKATKITLENQHIE